MYNVMDKVRDEIVGILTKALEKCGFGGADRVTLEAPKDKRFGDFSANIAMILAKEVGKAPRAIAEEIIENISCKGMSIEKIEIAGAGFINFYLKEEWVYDVVPLVEALGEDYGRSDMGGGKSVVVEFVSANPTGPMHMGNARGGALGDGIAKVLEMAGYSVTREFYMNDAGNQVEKFAASLMARYLQQFGDYPFPEDGYMGNDITELAKEFIKENGEKYGKEPSDQLKEALSVYGLEKNITNMKAILDKYRIHYDVWYHESELYKSGEVEQAVSDLKAAGAAYEKDGAVWLKLPDKDEVLVRANGIPTYFAADIAYHRNKLVTREFDLAINVWGADHHGHVARMKNALELLGIDGERLKVVIMQMVRLTSGGEAVRMSKRTGGAVTLAELLEDIGIDAARYFFNMRLAGSHFDFDLDLAVEKSNENPVYYVQYAHARICSILSRLGETFGDDDKFADADLRLLTDPEERELMKKIACFPDEVVLAAEALEPSRLTHFAKDLAGGFHAFYNACRVMSEDRELSRARARLINAVRVTLRNTLGALGVSAPERM